MIITSKIKEYINCTLLIQSFPLDADGLNNYTRELTDKLSRKDYDMVMCVLEKSRADIYNSIKMITLSNCGIPSQVYFKCLKHKRKVK